MPGGWTLLLPGRGPTLSWYLHRPDLGRPSLSFQHLRHWYANNAIAMETYQSLIYEIKTVLTRIFCIGFESTWIWVSPCEVGGSTTFACGEFQDGSQQMPTCPANAVINSESIQTTSTTSS